MIYNKQERALVITKQIFKFHNTNVLLEMTSNMENVDQIYIWVNVNTNLHIQITFTHKLTTNRNFQMPSLFFVFLLFL